jgi:transcriptional regulator with XRE-family HTH domain
MTPLQLKLARAALGLSIRDLAAAANVAPSTVVRFEAGGATQRRTVDDLRVIIEARGIMFLDAADGGSATIRVRE